MPGSGTRPEATKGRCASSLAAMAPLLVASLAVPHAFGKDALLFGIAYFLVRALHVLAYAVLARGNPVLGGVVARLARTILPAAGVLVLAGVFTGPGRVACWAIALAIDYGGLLLGSTQGWRVEPSHFAERHGLIIIIALGESIVALGVGAAGLGDARPRACAPAECSGRSALRGSRALPACAAFKRRNVGSFNYPRLVAGAALLMLAPIVTALPALLSLGLVALIVCTLIGYEVRRYAETRDRIRHGMS